MCICKTAQRSVIYFQTLHLTFKDHSRNQLILPDHKLQGVDKCFFITKTLSLLAKLALTSEH